MTTVKQIALDIATTLKEHPERWCKGYRGKADVGCLVYHISNRVSQASHGDLGWAVYNSLLKEVGEYGALEAWNDAPERTVQDVISLCERVASL